MAEEVHQETVVLELTEFSPTSRGRSGEDELTRPSLVLGRQLSMKKKKVILHIDGPADDEGQGEEGGPTRGAAAYRSLQLRPKKKAVGAEVGLRRASSLRGMDSSRYDQWQELTLDLRNIRQSSRRLEDRMAQHRKTLDRNRRQTQYARRNVWQLFLNVQWPKIKSRLKVVYGYELWNGHLQQVEGHFGTAVVSYFIFLRWLFLLNLTIFLLWFGLAVIPQLVWVAGTDPDRSPSQLACVFPLNISDGVPRICTASSGPPLASYNVTQLLQRNEQQVLCRGGEVSEREGLLTVGQCQFDRENGTLVAQREDRDRSVSGLSNCSNITDVTGVEYYFMCSPVDPVIQWYEYIFDFALGRGIFNDTVLFQGRYNNRVVRVIGSVGYNLPLAYLLLTGTVFLISVVLLVHKMGQAYNESNIHIGRQRAINYCNKLFSSWEFSVTEHRAAKLRKAQIKREFEEDIADLKKRSKKRDAKERALVILSRTITNIFVILILIGSGVAIFMAAQLGLDSQLEGDSLQLEGFVLPVVFTALNITLPVLFSFLARFERFKTASGEIRMTLVRAIIVRLSSLIVLFITLFILISCTQSFEGGDEIEEEEMEEEGTCRFSVPDINIGSDNRTSQFAIRENCPQCWETFVGQEMYKLGLVNFILSAITTVSVETTRNVLSRIPLKLFSERLGKGNFNIARSILDLIYTQALLWLGFFYSPFLPFVILCTSFLLFYVKKYSLIYNLVPSERGTFKTTKTNFLFLFLLLSVLLASLVPIGYAVARLHPSDTCGPFRGQELIYDVLTNVLEQADCSVQQTFDYFQSTTFLVPLIIILILICYAQWVVLRARKHRFILLQKQLLLEAADSTFYGQELQKVKKGGVVDEGEGVAEGVTRLEQRLSALPDREEEERKRWSKLDSSSSSHPHHSSSSTSLTPSPFQRSSRISLPT